MAFGDWRSVIRHASRPRSRWWRCGCAIASRTLIPAISVDRHWCHTQQRPTPAGCVLSHDETVQYVLRALAGLRRGEPDAILQHLEEGIGRGFQAGLLAAADPGRGLILRRRHPQLARLL